MASWTVLFVKKFFVATKPCANLPMKFRPFSKVALSTFGPIYLEIISKMAGLPLTISMPCVINSGFFIKFLNEGSFIISCMAPGFGAPPYPCPYAPAPPPIMFIAIFIISGLFIISLTIGLFIISSMFMLLGSKPPGIPGIWGAAWVGAAVLASSWAGYACCYGAAPAFWACYAWLRRLGFSLAIFIDILIISGVSMLRTISSYASSIGGPPGLLFSCYLASSLFAFIIFIWA